MKNFSIVIALIVLVSANVVCQEKEKVSEKTNKESSTNACLENSDSLYSRKDMLEKLSKILNETSTYYYNARYKIKKTLNLAEVQKNERPFGFSIFDLTDTSNTGKPLGECIEFKNNHIYHFALIDTPYSFSHIAVLEDGNLKVFRAINCKDKGDTLDEVTNYLNETLKEDKNKDEILIRVRNYRKYGIYTTVDTPNLECKSS